VDGNWTRLHSQFWIPAPTPCRFISPQNAEKMLREAMEELPEPCRSLLELLFFSDERTSYLDVGGLFGWSKDSVGSARLRCLDKVRKILERKGF